MFSLQDLLGEQQGNTAVDEISRSVGADNSMVSTAIQAALPAILNGLANNAATPAGAESLNTALEEDHSDGSVLGNLGGLGSLIHDTVDPVSPVLLVLLGFATLFGGLNAAAAIMMMPSDE